MSQKKVLHLNIRLLLLVSGLLFNNIRGIAQIVKNHAYIKASHIEIGINGQGGFEGVDTTIASLLPGMHMRTNSPYFGFVANPQLNSWTTFDGDFFTPGDPENGWGIQIGNSGAVGSVSANNNCHNDLSPGSIRRDISGKITKYDHTLDCYSVDWEGDLIKSGTNLHIKVNYFVKENDLFYTTTVSIKNNTNSTIPLLYYHRNVDPDNNKMINPIDNHITTNTIENQPTTDPCHIACVSAVQFNPTKSYMALAGIGDDFRVIYGGFANRSSADVWNGNSWEYVLAQGSTDYIDRAIALSYRIQNFLPGTTRTFKYAVILSSNDKDKALTDLFYLSSPKSQYLSLNSCSADTLKVCEKTTKLEILGANPDDYAWTWSPSTYLSSSSSYSTICSPLTSTFVYTITGTPTNTCYTTPINYVFTIKSSPVVADYTGINDDIATLGNTLTLTNTSTRAQNYEWQLCKNASTTSTNVSVPLLDTGYCCVKLKAFTDQCVDSISKCVRVIPEPVLFIPNVFTPNGDRVNEIFKPSSVGVKTMRCSIYNRWGAKLYEWENVSGGWDGNTPSGPASSGTYFYVIDYVTIKGVSKTEKGFLSLLRD